MGACCIGKIFLDDVPRLLGKCAYSITLKNMLRSDPELKRCASNRDLPIGYSIFWWAISVQRTESVKVLLDAGIDPLCPDLSSMCPETPYHYAARGACPVVLRHFLTAFNGDLKKINELTMPTEHEPAKTALDFVLCRMGDEHSNQRELTECMQMLQEAGCKTSAELAAMNEHERELFWNKKDTRESSLDRTNSGKRVQFSDTVMLNELSPHPLIG
jgi:hypothetical protein